MLNAFHEMRDDRELLPRFECLSFPSREDTLIGTILRASGDTPHPTAVLLHGFPGHGQSRDLAHVLRHFGWNVATIHYAGSWGSDGVYSFEHVIEDTKAAVSHLTGTEESERLSRDETRLVLIGHSLGAFAALQVAAADERVTDVVALAPFNPAVFVEKLLKDPQSLPSVVNEFDEDQQGILRGTSGEMLISELVEHSSDWDLRRTTFQLGKKRLLIVGATSDDISTVGQHVIPIVELLRDLSHPHLCYIQLDADHEFFSERLKLAEVVLRWLTDTLAG